MVSLVTSKAPNLPYATVEYDARYQDQLTNVLRLYFNTIDNAIAEIIRILNYTGPFETLYANTVEAGTVNANLVDANYTETINLNALLAAIQLLQANTVLAANLQGGNAVFTNMTAAQANASLFTGSGRELQYPHIAASDNTDQYADNDNDPTIVKWDTADELLGFTLNVDYTATATYDGVYKIDYSLQFANTDNAAHDVYVWLQVNGNDLAKSASKFTIPARKSAGDYAFVVAYSSITFDVNAGDDIGLWWATDKAYKTVGPVDGVYMEYIPAQSAPPYAHPAAPSSIGSIVYVSAPKPPKTRIVPVGVSGFGSVGVPTVVIT